MADGQKLPPYVVLIGHLKHTFDINIGNGCRKHDMTPTGRLKRAALTEMCWWILEAWQSISQDMIAESFKVTGISNMMDGSEGDFLWHWSDKETCQEDSSDCEED
jgi:hypothetical protein